MISHLDEAIYLKDKINDLHQIISKLVAPDEVQPFYPRGLLEGLEQLQKEHKVGPYTPERKSSWIADDLTNLVAFTVAQKFAGVVLRDDEAMILD